MPVRRIRRRYLAFKIISDRVFGEKEVQDAILKGVLQLYGLKGLSLIGYTLIKFNEKEQRGIIRCSHSYMRLMRASLAYITRIGDAAASIIVEKVSGTIKSFNS
ncbi:MAG: Rpp14/Pop5 family protein [Candidatus Bathyarchaeia archaeon]